jgi:hypothetical protein
MTGARESGASSPAPMGSMPSSFQHPDQLPYMYNQRTSTSMHREPGAPTSSIIGVEGGVTSLQTTGRYEETAFHRNELEAVKRENEALKRRIRELERTLSARRQSDASRTRSESVSTTASVGFRDSAIVVGRDRERERDGEDDGVRVGESARSAGVLR